MDAAPLVVVDNVDGKHWYTSIQKIQETSLEACAEECEKLVIRARQHPPPLLPMVAVGETYPEQDGVVHGTLVSRIRVLSVERKLALRLGISQLLVQGQQ